MQSFYIADLISFHIAPITIIITIIPIVVSPLSLINSILARRFYLLFCNQTKPNAREIEQPRN